MGVRPYLTFILLLVSIGFSRAQSYPIMIESMNFSVLLEEQRVRKATVSKTHSDIDKFTVGSEVHKYYDDQGACIKIIHKDEHSDTVHIVSNSYHRNGFKALEKSGKKMQSLDTVMISRFLKGDNAIEKIQILKRANAKHHTLTTLNQDLKPVRIIDFFSDGVNESLNQFPEKIDTFYFNYKSDGNWKIVTKLKANQQSSLYTDSFYYEKELLKYHSRTLEQYQVSESKKYAYNKRGKVLSIVHHQKNGTTETKTYGYKDGLISESKSTKTHPNHPGKKVVELFTWSYERQTD